MLTLRELFKRPKPPTSAEIREVMAQLEADRTRIATEHGALNATKADIYLTGSADEVSAHQSKIVDAGLDLDRINTQLSALQGKLAATEAEEREADLDGQVQRGWAEAQRGAELVRKITAAAQVMAADLAEVAKITKATEALNHEMLGRREPITTPDKLARPDAYTAAFHGQNLLFRTVLVGPDGHWIWHQTHGVGNV